jgi:hypothetical protein
VAGRCRCPLLAQPDFQLARAGDRLERLEARAQTVDDAELDQVLRGPLDGPGRSNTGSG